MAVININGSLILDQTAGLQDDDVDVTKTVNGLAGGLDSDFLAYLNTLSLTDAQQEFAAMVEGASQANMVTVDKAPNENVAKLFFSDATGNDFDGDLVSGVTTLAGDPLYFWSAAGGKVVLVTTSNQFATAGTVVAAFYLESTDGTNTAAKIESITFEALQHPITTNEDDSVDFSDALRVSAVVTTSIGDTLIVDDDGPNIVTSTDSVQLTVDETYLDGDDSDSFAEEFTPDFGTDGPGGITYTLGIGAGSTELVASINSQPVVLSLNQARQVVGTAGGEIVFVVSVDSAGNVTLDQKLAVRHDPDTGPNQSTTLAADHLITLTATITDADGDSHSAVLNIGRNLNFLDDAPSVAGGGTEPTIRLDETTYGSATGNFAPSFLPTFGNDLDGGTTYSLNVTAGVVTDLFDSNTGEAISVAMAGDVVEGRTATSNLLVFTVSVGSTGVVTFDQDRSIKHADASNPDDSRSLGAANLITLTATVSDKDGDQDSATIHIADNLIIEDDGPLITVSSSAASVATAVEVGNAAGQSASGAFGYHIGADDHSAAFYAAPTNGSDFVAMTLAGTVGEGSPAASFLSSSVTRSSETADTAVFNWSFTYDADPLTAGAQTGTAAGTLSFNKVADTFSIAVTDAVEGYSFNVLQTSELLRKAPPGNTGQPKIVVSELNVNNGTTDTNGFYVQFTANTNPNGSPFGFNDDGNGPTQTPNDTTFDVGQLISSNTEDWVSATGSSNGVAGDTIQKGELLTLRFFNENILGDVNPTAPGGGTEKTTPTDSVAGLVLKFDGIGNSEDLIVLLDLIDATGGTTTRAVFVENRDLIKGTVPAPYNTEFSLDNNDALAIIEANDYNLAGETYQIQGVQIMQSGNGLTGSAINLNGAVGDSGGSPPPNQASTQPWEATDQDVLKITDIGFVETTSGFQDASLHFSFKIQDADLDTTEVQHIYAEISNGVV